MSDETKNVCFVLWCFFCMMAIAVISPPFAQLSQWAVWFIGCCLIMAISEHNFRKRSRRLLAQAALDDRFFWEHLHNGNPKPRYVSREERERMSR